MGVPLWLVYACVCILTLIILKSLKPMMMWVKMDFALPPSPPRRPIIGHLHLLKLPLHRSLLKLAHAYGPLLYLNMGSVPTVVVSSAPWAREFLHTNERDFADRPQGEASKRLFYGNKTVVMMEHGPLWRELKKLYIMRMLTMKRVEMFKEARQEEVAMAMEELSYRREGEVQVRKVVFSAVGNMMTRMLLSKRLFGYSDASFTFGEMIEEMAILFGTPVLGDLIPCLSWLDLGGHKRRMNRLSLRLDSFLENILTERLDQTSTTSTSNFLSHLTSHVSSIFNCSIPNYDDPDTCSSSSNDLDDGTTLLEECRTQDFLALLLDLYKEDEGPKGREFIKGILLDLLSAGTETTTTVVEWAMAELLRNPHYMTKLQAELASSMGNLPHTSNGSSCIHDHFKSVLINDDVILKLPYLQAVLKETLRLHPPLPVVVRQMSKCLTHGKELGGFKLPPKTKLLVNVWALGRDTTTWGDKAHSFSPDKFLAPNSCDFHGQHYEFLPFGTGRRGCPGMNLGLSMAGLILANFVYFFSWELPDGYTLDLSESPSRTAPMARPLRAIPSHRRIKS